MKIIDNFLDWMFEHFNAAETAMFAVFGLLVFVLILVLFVIEPITMTILLLGGIVAYYGLTKWSNFVSSKYAIWNERRRKEFDSRCGTKPPA